MAPIPPHTQPLFQIDGNFGATPGIAEMLLQSHEEEIHLLPALPLAWSTGYYKGLKARGNIEVDVNWENGRMTSVYLRPAETGTYLVRFPENNHLISVRPMVNSQLISKDLIQIDMKAYEEYVFLFSDEKAA